jgi:hypothetical protein
MYLIVYATMFSMYPIVQCNGNFHFITTDCSIKTNYTLNIYFSFYLTMALPAAAPGQQSPH